MLKKVFVLSCMVLGSLNACAKSDLLAESSNQVFDDKIISDTNVVRNKNAMGYDIKSITKQFQNYLQNMENVSGNFYQSSSNGDVQTGKFYISIPGKMKIEYENGVLILADGRDFIYYDKGNDQITVLDLKTSPAGVLLSRTKLDSVGAEIVKIEKSSDDLLLYTSIKNASINAMIIFKVQEKPFKLLGWIIKDVQGVTTNFSMQDVKNVTNGFDKNMFILHRKKTYGSDGVKSGDDYY